MRNFAAGMKTPPSPEPSGRTRVLRLFSRLNIGGPSLHVILLTRGLEARGYETRLVVGQEAPHEGNLLALAAEKGVVCSQMAGLGREIRPLSDVRTLLELYRLIRKFRPAIVHTHAAKAGVLGRIAARLAGVPVVVHTYHGHVLHSYFGPLKTRFFRLLEKSLSPLSDVLVAVSEAVKQDLLRFGVGRPGKIRVVPLGLELERLAGPLSRGSLRQEAGFSEDAPLIGIVGRLVPIKDVSTFLDAALLVRKSLPSCRFAVVGDGEERALLMERSARLGLSECVHFHGWRRDMELVFGDLDVVVNSSLNEGTPVALIEALAASRPVVATRVGGTPDLLGSDERGLVVPPRDPGRLAEAILATLGDPAAAQARARAGQRHVLDRHSVTRLLSDLDELYRELLARVA